VSHVVDGGLVDAEIEKWIGGQDSLQIMAYGGVKPPGVSKASVKRVGH
jgi:hypothetical protein